MHLHWNTFMYKTSLYVFLHPLEGSLTFLFFAFFVSYTLFSSFTHSLFLSDNTILIINPKFYVDDATWVIPTPFLPLLLSPFFLSLSTPKTFKREKTNEKRLERVYNERKNIPDKKYFSHFILELHLWFY